MLGHKQTLVLQANLRYTLRSSMHGLACAHAHGATLDCQSHFWPSRTVASPCLLPVYCHYKLQAVFALQDSIVLGQPLCHSFGSTPKSSGAFVCAQGVQPFE